MDLAMVKYLAELGKAGVFPTVNWKRPQMR